MNSVGGSAQGSAGVLSVGVKAMLRGRLEAASSVSLGILGASNVCIHHSFTDN